MIKVQNLCFKYPGKELFFSNLHFELPPGHIYGLLGKNGAGKTTLLKLLTGLRFPQSGSVNVSDFQPRYRQSDFLQQVYFIPEEFYLPNYSRQKYEDTYAPFYPLFQHDKFLHYLHQFEISESCNVGSLSMGQKKKFLLSFAFATSCQFLFLDEPTNGLDIPSKKQFRKLVAELITQRQTVIISTHQVHDVSKLLDSVIILEDGKIILNEKLTRLEECFKMTLSPNAKHASHTLYTQDVIGGTVSLEKNETGEPSNIDLELLFNAVLYNAETITNISKGENAK